MASKPETFQAGDVVYLKSGSLAMTVESVTTDHKLTVRWFVSPPERDEAGNLCYFYRAEGLPTDIFTKSRKLPK